MDISNKDRVLLINQLRILKILDSNNADSYDATIDLLTSGFKIFYSDIEPFLSDDMPESEGRLVLDVLSLYRMVDHHIHKNPGSKVAEHLYARFDGFDGNYEGQHLAFTEFLINTQGKFRERVIDWNEDFNSHSPCLGKYRSMIAAWENVEKKYDLSEEQVLAILDA